MARKFKLIPDAQLANYGTPLRLAQDKYNEKLGTYSAYVNDEERAREAATQLAIKIVEWQTAIKALKRFT